MFRKLIDVPKEVIIRAQRTAFVSKFIILRETKISPAHTVIEMLTWEDKTTYLELANAFEKIFKVTGRDKTYLKDIKKAIEHAKNLSIAFVNEYARRSGLSFLESLIDYEKSIFILFGPNYLSSIIGWCPASILARKYEPVQLRKLSEHLRKLKNSRHKRGKNFLTCYQADKLVSHKVIGPQKVLVRAKRKG
ncbi:MAG: hypothetical protein NZT61_00120 [Deltaproteobacteria bacterium]|nr:hypothetical protein [Deltaproteobacteria bacterium]